MSELRDDGVPETSWWLGFWRAGDNLYWWTTAVSPTAGRQAVRHAVRARVRPVTWRRTVDPAAASSGPDDHTQAAFVAAGALPWSQVEPSLAALGQAVPVQGDAAVRQQADSLARRRRQARDMASLSLTASAGEQERAALLAEQIDLAFRAGALHRAATQSSLTRAWSGPLVDPDANRRLCHDLAVLLPDVLREFLTAPTTTAAVTVLVAPAPELGLVPWELLPLEGDVRLIERAAVRGGISPATVADLALPAAPDRPHLPGLLVLDPAVDTSGDGDPVPIYPRGLPHLWTSTARESAGDVLVGRTPGQPGPGDCEQRAPGLSRGQLSRLLQSRSWGRLVFHGHVSAGDALSPTAAALHLARDPDGPEPPITTTDGRALEQPGSTAQLSARVWLHSPHRWPMPRRVAFIACQADDAGYVEQTGLTLAALNAGARTVVTTRWTLPTDGSAAGASTQAEGAGEPAGRPTTAVAVAVDQALAAEDPMTALRDWQLTQLETWRAATTTATRRAHAPLLWAALVGYLLPDTLTVTPLRHHGGPLAAADGPAGERSEDGT
jgi:hypothetical protein